MFYCPFCLEQMKPLFTGFFCPNDCDRPHLKKASACEIIDTLEAISLKMPSAIRKSFLERSRGRSGGFYVLKSDGMWMVSEKPAQTVIRRSDVIIVIDGNGRPHVWKNKYGDETLDGIPDYKD